MSFALEWDMVLRTLGELALEGSDFRRPKPLLLLAYLALEGPKARRYLAELFFGDTADPLNGLSRALSFLRSDASGVIEADDARVWTLVTCDATQLMELLDAGQFREGVRLYRGPLVETFRLPLGTELEEWVYHTREFLAGRVREALLRLGEQEAGQGRLEAATKLVETAYRLPGAPELEPEDFRRVYTLLVAGGNPRAADIRKEAEAFGLSLLLSANEARDELRRSNDAISMPRHNLPLSRTSFVGRQVELKEVKHLLAEPTCRLVTLLGPGGVGKSRLAVQAAHELLLTESFPDGVIFTALDALMSPELIPYSIAEALGLAIVAPGNVVSQLESFLRSRRLLLLLDNFEHLVKGAPVVSRLLDACPDLKVLVTSRERLQLEEEWCFELEGLPFPVDSGALQPESSDALQLFVQRAKRARLGFSLTKDELPHVVTICRLVGGYPLGIELAAVWVKVLAPAEIAQEIARNLSFLATPVRNLASRHRSMHATLEYSWMLLTSVEQQVLRQLAVFVGGFRQEAAATVAGATIPELASLVDKSLLRIGPSGRYDRHTLLYEFTKEKLEEHPKEKAQAMRQHGTYYHHFLRRTERSLRGTAPKAAMEAIEEELENIRVAWRWAIHHEEFQDLRASAVPLRLFFDRRGRFQEGLDMFALAVTSLESSSSAQPAVLGTLLVEQAWLAYRLGHHDSAALLAERGLNLLQSPQDSKNVVEGLYVLGALELDSGAYAKAREVWRDACALAKAQKDYEAVAHALNLLGIVQGLMGRHHQATRYYRMSLGLHRQLGDKEGVVEALNNLATLMLSVGAVDEARPLLQEGLQLAREAGIRRVVPFLLDNLAKVARESHDFSQAQALGRQALQIAHTTGDKSLELRILDTLGGVSLDLEDYEEARKCFVRGLGEAWRISTVPAVLQALLGLAEVLSRQDRLERAAQLLGFILYHPSAPKATELSARSLCATLSSKLPVGALEIAMAQGEALTWTEIRQLWPELGA